MDVARKLLGLPPDVPIDSVLLLFAKKGERGVRIIIVDGEEPEFHLIKQDPPPVRSINEYLELAPTLQWICGSSRGRYNHTLHGEVPENW